MSPIIYDFFVYYCCWLVHLARELTIRNNDPPHITSPHPPIRPTIYLHALLECIHAALHTYIYKFYISAPRLLRGSDLLLFGFVRAICRGRMQRSQPAPVLAATRDDQVNERKILFQCAQGVKKGCVVWMVACALLFQPVGFSNLS